MNIRYLEYLDLYPGCIYVSDSGEYDINIFKIIKLCNNYFEIINPQAINSMPSYNGTIADSKNYLSRFSFYRKIELSSDKSAIDFESFSLEIPTGSIDFIYDYSFMYDTEISDIQSMSKVIVNNEHYIAWIYPIAGHECIRCKNRYEYLNHQYVEGNNVYAHYFLDNNHTDNKDDIPMYKLLPI